jgi:hypothetical protein
VTAPTVVDSPFRVGRMVLRSVIVILYRAFCTWGAGNNEGRDDGTPLPPTMTVSMLTRAASSPPPPFRTLTTEEAESSQSPDLTYPTRALLLLIGSRPLAPLRTYSPLLGVNIWTLAVGLGDDHDARLLMSDTGGTHRYEVCRGEASLEAVLLGALYDRLYLLAEEVGVQRESPMIYH